MTASFANRWNTGALEAAYEQWQKDPSSVDERWQLFFEGFALGLDKSDSPPPAKTARPTVRESLQVGVFRLVYAYRDLGHLIANLDPLSQPPDSHPRLQLAEFGLDESDLNESFNTSLIGTKRASLRQILKVLRKTYCSSIGVEYMHIQDPEIRQWLQQRMEPCCNQPNLTRRQKLRLLMDLCYAELFEEFLHTRFVGQKRFSLEGAETLIPIVEVIVENAANHGVREIVMGMAHRGRLNVLVNVLGKPYSEIFAEFEENWTPGTIDGSGDVKYHLGFSADRKTAQGNPVHISLTPNPSHLEAVNPVVEGRVRAKQGRFGDFDRVQGLPLLIHGDAAFAGQGLVAETLNLSQLKGYRTGGTIHIIINNQIGFTTSPTDARSTHYCTDVAKMIQVPIFHVNAEDPEAAMMVAQWAVEFRQTFHMDVVIDMYCYRRHGHNEGDEPDFTQPLLYAKIDERPSLSEIFTEKLILRGDLTADEVESLQREFEDKLQTDLEEVKSRPPKLKNVEEPNGAWQGLQMHYIHEEVDTTIARQTLEKMVHTLTRFPEDFRPHPKIARQLKKRWELFQDGQPLDWALAEALAFGSLLQDGTHVRLSGQDSRRGTFSHRHAFLYDTETGEPYVPLQHLSETQARFSCYDSMLSEAGVLGFEFGYSLDAPGALVLWEAQFGDFCNGAQVILDQFIASSSSKWQRDSGLVLLLPHGYEGQGPEHSSARLGRFLQMCADNNMQVCNFTTPAQFFHALRRQVKRDFRRPLIVMTPKSLLRHKRAVSPLDELSDGQFHDVLDDPGTEPNQVRRLLLCSGKVYYDLLEKKEKVQDRDIDELALVRLEQFYPFPEEHLVHTLERYPNVRTWIWVQEEPQNMGGWHFVEPRLRQLGYDFQYVGRDAAASPATGSRFLHLREQKELVAAALTGLSSHLVRSTPDAALRAKRRQVSLPE